MFTAFFALMTVGFFVALVANVVATVAGTAEFASR
jgi:hypothetical protein